MKQFIDPYKKQQFFIEYNGHTYVVNVAKIHSQWKVKEDADN